MHTIISSLSRGLSIKIYLLQKRLKWTERLFFRHSKKKKNAKAQIKNKVESCYYFEWKRNCFYWRLLKNHIEIVTSAPKMRLSDRSLNQHSSISLLIGGFFNGI